MDLAAFMGEADSDSEAEGDDDELVVEGDEFEMSDEDGEDELAGALEHDSAFDTSDEEGGDKAGEEDEEEDVDMDDELPPHLRPNAALELDSDEDLDGQITTNLMGDITASEFSLPAVTKSRARTAEDAEEDDDDEQFDELEGRTSLRDVESRMRWLVGILGGKEKDEEGEVIPGGDFRGIQGL